MAVDRQQRPFQPEIPEQLFFRIGEVKKFAGVEAHVLRFWENEFPTLSPRKTPSGQRQFRRKDLETILAIKHLLYDEGYTIAGARKALRSRGKAADEPPGEESAPAAAAETDVVSATSPAHPANGANHTSREALAEIRVGLQQIMELLRP